MTIIALVAALLGQTQSLDLTVHREDKTYNLHLEYNNNIRWNDIFELYAGIQIGPATPQMAAQGYRGMNASPKTRLSPRVRALAVTVTDPSQPGTGANLAWEIPRGFSWGPDRGVVLIGEDVTVSASVTPRAGFKVKWWGTRYVFHTRDEVCAALGASVAGVATLVVKGGPAGGIAGAAIGVQAAIVAANVGTLGTVVDITWLGILKKVKPRGRRTTCVTSSGGNGTGATDAPHRPVKPNQHAQ